jgi:hypothetical protein
MIVWNLHETVVSESDFFSYDDLETRMERWRMPFRARA